jgi:ribulose-5-phosphate 4-epimerase/fuculose-1-phosphate aldolase
MPTTAPRSAFHWPKIRVGLPTAIYEARPEVKAVVHSHSPAVIPFEVTRAPLRPIFHLSSFLATARV